MFPSIVCNTYSGRYGTEKDNGDMIHLTLTISQSDNINYENKEIIFLIDISGSMTSSMKAVKSSMLAFRDAMLQLSPQEMATLSAEERDCLIRKINMRIITFSNSAKEIWSNHSKENFENTIINLSTESLTNMGDALKLAFSKINPQKFTWVVAMTDGLSNQGPCRTVNSFHQLVTTNKPLNTKIITLGYGSEFDPETLNQVGSFVHVEDSEMIPVVLGNVAEEFATSVGFNCVVDVPNQEITEFTDDTLIVPDGEKEPNGKTIVGDRVIGTLCTGKTYHYVYLPHGNNVSTISDYNHIIISYVDINTQEIVTQIIEIVHTGLEPTDDLIKLYFQSESKRLIYRLYRAIQRGSVKKEIQHIQKVLENWEVSEEKEVVLKLINDIVKNNDDKKISSVVLNQANGNNYSTPSIEGYGLAAMTSVGYYMASPAINGEIN